MNSVISENAHFDMAVIGSGPAGQRAAIQAAKAGKRVCLIEKQQWLGGAQVITGTIPSKTMREAAMYLSGIRMRNVYGQNYTVKTGITFEDLMHRVEYVRGVEAEVVRNQLVRNQVRIIRAQARFAGKNRLELDHEIGGKLGSVTADHVVIATGTRPAQDKEFEFDGRRIITSDELLEMENMPKSMIIYGGGVIGSEYATIFATVGVRVVLIDKRMHLMRFMDREITDALSYRMNRMRTAIRLGEAIEEVHKVNDPQGERIRVVLTSGSEFVADVLLYCMGRVGNVEALNLSDIGIGTDHRGMIQVDGEYRTAVPHVFAVGDVIGAPALAATSFEQGRIAACHALNIPVSSMGKMIPYGIYTIPELSCVGATEQELSRNATPFLVGKAHFGEIARGHIIGDDTGLLKILFCPSTHRLLGIHILGDGATDLVHLGQICLSQQATIETLIGGVFNYPTLAECYKVAALDAANQLGLVQSGTDGP